MSNSVVVAVEDPQAIDTVVSVANRLGLSVVLSKDDDRPVEELPAGEGTRLMVLDLDAPAFGGLDTCRRLQMFSDILVITLGDYSDSDRTVMALRSGADCYIPKPVSPEILHAQMEALLRRHPWVTNRPEAVTVRGLTISYLRKEVRLGGEVVAVTPAEYRLLASLASRPGRVVSASELLREMSGYNCPEHEAQEIVKVHVSRLRNKIDWYRDQPGYILNVRGFGYMLERRTISRQAPVPAA